MKNIFLSLYLLSTLTLNIYSYFDKSSHGTTATSIVKLNINPRCVSMGEACNSDVSDASSIDINPSNLIKVRQSSIFLSHNSFFEDIFLQSLFYAKNLGRNTGSFGLGVKYLSYGKIEKTDEYANDIGRMNPNEMIVFLGFASYLTGLTKDKEERLVFGGVGKFIRQRLEDSASTLSADIGLTFPYLFEKKLALSVVFQNIIGSIKMDKESYDLTKIIRIGSSIFLTKNMTINSDIIMPQDNFLYIAMGLETKIDITKRTKFFLRTGANTNNISDFKGFKNINFGFGIRNWEYSIDYSYSPFGDFGNIHRIALSINY